MKVEKGEVLEQHLQHDHCNDERQVDSCLHLVFPMDSLSAGLLENYSSFLSF